MSEKRWAFEASVHVRGGYISMAFNFPDAGLMVSHLRQYADMIEQLTELGDDPHPEPTEGEG